MVGNRRCPSLLILLLAWMAAAPTWAQTLREKTSLFSSPQGNVSVGQAAEGSTLQVLERSGFWLRIRTNNLTGWVRAATIKFGAASGGAVTLDTGRTTRGNIVSTSAARGMSKGQLLAAVPDISAVNRLDLLVPPTDAVASFRANARLELVRITPLTEATAASPKSNQDAEGRRPAKESGDPDAW